MNILVTGGAGYIGSHACKALSKAGFTPIVYDNLVYGHPWAVKWGPLVVGDISDRTSLEDVIEKYKPEAVMHFAAYAYVGESVVDPAKYYRNNVAGTLTLLEAMRNHEIRKLVFSSTCATYGNPTVTPITEEQPQRPINPYGMSKLTVENILRDFDLAYGIRSISLRYFNAAGADPEGDIGESHDPETHLIPLLLDVAAGKRESLTLYGMDHDTPDGTCIRDYIHVSDLADAHVMALKALCEGCETTAYNLSNGKGFSVREVIDEVSRVTGKFIKYENGPRRDGDPAVLIGDSTLIEEALGWRPKHPDLAKMVSTAWRWRSREL